MPDPPIRFTLWTPWAARNMMPNSHLPGVYLLAQWAETPPRVANRDVFGDDGATLYVAAFVPEGLSRELRALYIRYVERKLVWEYARAWGAPPVCNRR